MDLKNKADLEKYFADHFDTVIFPILADLYKTEGDLNRAKKVCEIGLEYHPNNVEGILILAEIYIATGDLTEAEKYLKTIMMIEPLHYRASIYLAETQQKLNRAPDSIAKLWQKIGKIDPTHPNVETFVKPAVKKIKEPTKEAETIEQNDSEEQKIEVKKDEPIVEQEIVEEPVKIEPRFDEIAESIPEEKASVDNNAVDPIEANDLNIEDIHEKSSDILDNSKEDKGDTSSDKVAELKEKLEAKTESLESQKETEKPAVDEILGPKPPSIKPQKISEEQLQSLDISPRMATFTMVNVLKRQKLYQQAIAVLSMLEEKGADPALIAQERDNLAKLLQESENQ